MPLESANLVETATALPNCWARGAWDRSTARGTSAGSSCGAQRDDPSTRAGSLFVGAAPRAVRARGTHPGDAVAPRFGAGLRLFLLGGEPVPGHGLRGRGEPGRAHFRTGTQAESNVIAGRRSCWRRWPTATGAA
jgi:hypothetical protein